MSDQLNNGGPAFPFSYEVPNTPEFDPKRPDAMYPLTMATVTHPGMTLRDYFAAKAMQGLIAGCADADYNEELVAESAYMMADVMLAARGKQS